MLPFSPLSLALRRRESSSRYRIRSRFFAIAVLLFSCAVFCACSSEDKKRGQEKPEQKYPKLRNYTLDLSIISTRGNYRRSDVNPILRFSVRNAGANQLSIHEWKMHEQENIRVLYAPCPERGTATKLPPEAWKESERLILKGGVPRYPLELAPNNAVLVDVPLNFIRKLNKPGRYAVKGELDLYSVSAESVPIEIEIQ